MPLLQLASVSKTFRRGGNEINVLQEVSLELDDGEFVAVYGQRNAGKTTLLKVAAGFEAPDSGLVLFRGENLACMSRRGFSKVHREQIAWVEHAGPRSYGLSMRAYVSMPLLSDMGASQAQRRADSALTEVGAEDCADRDWDELSDTARMLVAIAHALVRQPSLLVVDDPTVGLGMADRDKIVGLLRSTADRGVGILMAVPDMPAMARADQLHALGRGQLLSPSDPSPDGGADVLEFPGGKNGS